jgi:hypothetical protein
VAALPLSIIVCGFESRCRNLILLATPILSCVGKDFAMLELPSGIVSSLLIKIKTFLRQRSPGSESCNSFETEREKNKILNKKDKKDKFSRIKKHCSGDSYNLFTVTLKPNQTSLIFVFLSNTVTAGLLVLGTYMALQPFGPLPLFQFRNPIHGRTSWTRDHPVARRLSVHDNINTE